MMIITKIDEACPETEKTLRNVYMSKYVKQKVRFRLSVSLNRNTTSCYFTIFVLYEHRNTESR